MVEKRERECAYQEVVRSQQAIHLKCALQAMTNLVCGSRHTPSLQENSSLAEMTVSAGQLVGQIVGTCRQ